MKLNAAFEKKHADTNTPNGTYNVTVAITFIG